MDRILNMIIRQVVNRLVRHGVDAGVEQVARRQARRGEGAEDLTPEQRQRVQEQQRTARQVVNQTRRFTRF